MASVATQGVPSGVVGTQLSYLTLWQPRWLHESISRSLGRAKVGTRNPQMVLQAGPYRSGTSSLVMTSVGNQPLPAQEEVEKTPN